MQSKLRKGFVYTDLSRDISEQDDDTEAEQWDQDGRLVYRGNLDLSYKEQGLDVYSLQDDNLERIGLAEHETEDSSVFHALWFYENPQATFYQNPAWKTSGRTIWGKMSSEAYQDSLEADLKLLLWGQVMFPEWLISVPDIQECAECGKRSFSPNDCATVKKTFQSSSNTLYFLDESYVIFTQPPCDAYDPPEPEPPKERQPSEEEPILQPEPTQSHPQPSESSSQC